MDESGVIQGFLKVLLLSVVILSFVYVAYTGSVKDLCTNGNWSKIIGHYYYCPTEDIYRYCSKLSATNKTCYLMDESELPDITLADRKTLRIVKSDGISSLLEYNIEYISPVLAKINWKWKNTTLKKQIFSNDITPSFVESLNTVEEKVKCNAYKEKSICKNGVWESYNNTYYICSANKKIEQCEMLSSTKKTCYHPLSFDYCIDKTVEYQTKPFLNMKPESLSANLVAIKTSGLPVKYFVSRSLSKANQSNTTIINQPETIKGSSTKQAEEPFGLESGINKASIKKFDLDMSKDEGSFVINLENASVGQKIIIGFNSTEIMVEQPDNFKYINDITPSFNVSPVGDYNYYNLTLYINGVERGSAANVANNTYTVITSSELTSEGLYEWYVEAKSGGTSVSNSSVMYFTLDTTPPVVTINYPRDKGRVRVYNPYLNFTYSETYPEKVYFQIEGQPLNYTTNPYLLDNHTVLYLSMDEGAGNKTYDKSGYSNDGILYGASFNERDALKFDGVDDYVDCGNDSSLNLGDNEFTIEAWVYPKRAEGTWPDNRSTIFYEGSGGTWFVFIGYNKLYLQTLIDPYPAVSTPVGSIQNNQWHHVVASAKSGETDGIKLYINGELKGSGTLNLSGGSNKKYIGKLSTDYFNGTIDEVRIYNRALSAEEIKRHYAFFKYIKPHPIIMRRKL